MGRARHSDSIFNATTALIAAAALLLAGCAGNGQGLDANGQPLQLGSSGSGPLTADFDSIQAHVFTPIPFLQLRAGYRTDSSD